MSMLMHDIVDVIRDVLENDNFDVTHAFES